MSGGAARAVLRCCRGHVPYPRLTFRARAAHVHPRSTKASAGLVNLHTWLATPDPDLHFFSSDSDHADSGSDGEMEAMLEREQQRSGAEPNSEIPQRRLPPLSFSAFGVAQLPRTPSTVQPWSPELHRRKQLAAMRRQSRLSATADAEAQRRDEEAQTLRWLKQSNRDAQARWEQQQTRSKQFAEVFGESGQRYATERERRRAAAAAERAKKEEEEAKAGDGAAARAEARRRGRRAPRKRTPASSPSASPESMRDNVVVDVTVAPTMKRMDSLTIDNLLAIDGGASRASSVGVPQSSPTSSPVSASPNHSPTPEHLPPRDERARGLCEECEDARVMLFCPRCDMYYCTVCWQKVHVGALASHEPGSMPGAEQTETGAGNASTEDVSPGGSSPAGSPPSSSPHSTPRKGPTRMSSLRGGMGRSTRSMRRKRLWQLLRKAAAREVEQNKRIEAEKRERRKRELKKYAGAKARADFFSVYREFVRNDTLLTDTDDGLVKKSPRHEAAFACLRDGAPPEPTFIRHGNDASLNLAYYGVGSERVTSLVGGLGRLPHVDAVDMRDNRLSDSASAKVVEGIIANGKVIKCDLSQNAIGPTASEALSRLLALRPATLVELSLNDCKIGDRALRLLSVGLAESSCSVIHLDLSHNNINSTGAAALGSALLTNSTLQSLNCEWNVIQGAGAAAFADALAENHCLNRLNLAWNRFAQTGTDHISRAIRKNTHLQRLDLSYNGIPESAAVVLASGLRHNIGLRSLRLDGNSIRKAGARALQRADAVRPAIHALELWMERCDLSPSSAQVFDPENPSGEYELEMSKEYDRAIMGEMLLMSMEDPDHCRFKELVFNGQPVSKAKRQAWGGNPPASGAFSFTLQYVRRSVPATHKLKQSVVDGLMTRMKTRSKPKFSIMDVARMSLANAARDRRRSVAFNKESQEPIQDAKRLNVLELAATDLHFDTDAAQELLNTFDSDEGRVKAMSHIVTRMADPEQIQSFVNRNLNEKLRRRLAHIMGSYYHFDPRNPTGYYNLNLDMPFERALALRLQEINNDDARYNRTHTTASGEPLPDTSRNRDWMSWRHAQLDGADINFSDSFVIPKTGRLSLHYVSTQRPRQGRKVLRPHRFYSFMTEIGVPWVLPKERCIHMMRRTDPCYDDSYFSSDSEDETEGRAPRRRSSSRPGTGRSRRSQGSQPSRTSQSEATDDDTHDSPMEAALLPEALRIGGTPSTALLEKLVNTLRTQIQRRDLVFSCLQVALIIKAVPRCDLPAGEGVYQVRTELAVATFSRVLDMDNHKVLIQDQLTVEEHASLVYRLGWLNIWNPFYPDSFYALDLSVAEDWAICTALVKLAVDEPGENWVDETYNDFPFELPMSWVEEVPHAGVLTTTYYSGPNSAWAVPETRAFLKGHVLACYPLRPQKERRRDSLHMSTLLAGHTATASTEFNSARTNETDSSPQGLRPGTAGSRRSATASPLPASGRSTPEPSALPDSARGTSGGAGGPASARSTAAEGEASGEPQGHPDKPTPDVTNKHDDTLPDAEQAAAPGGAVVDDVVDGEIT